MRHELLLQSPASTPMGRMRLAGLISGGRGVVPEFPPRVYGSYAVACILRGTGFYKDINGISVPVSTGDAILVFPEVGHWYGTRKRQTWDELYLVFDGPVFDLWRASGLLNPTRPVLPAQSDFAARLRAVIDRASRPATALSRARELAELLQLLGELGNVHEDADTHGGSGLGFAARACMALDTDLGLELDFSDVADELGMSYETFRKRFGREVGTTPARYRAERRIETAKALLRYSPHMTNRQVAQTLGFADEYHFSRRFTQITGMPPRDFRASRVKQSNGNDTHD